MQYLLPINGLTPNPFPKQRNSSSLTAASASHLPPSRPQLQCLMAINQGFTKLEGEDLCLERRGDWPPSFIPSAEALWGGRGA